ncbi:hypothetical protein GCM10009636_17000 [Arthrobacter koreensis]|uniref:hypothetical protein n=1 Tax=Arthrobacter koreensis TaxID=199136 RepID=UPI00126508E9|nr:hypothetical protein [Arthrobacter koreensis]
MTPSTRYSPPPEPTVKPRSGQRWRGPVSTVLGILAGLALVAAVIAGYAGSLVSSTDRYVATVGPVIQDPAVQADLSGQISDQITSRMDISSTIQDEVAQRSDTRAAQGLASVLGPRIAERTNNLVEQTVSKAVASQAFAVMWTDANRAAHQVLVRALEDDPGGVASIGGNGDVSISTTAMISEAKSRLLAQGVAAASAIPDDAGQDYTVFSAPGLAAALSALDTLGRVSAVLPWAALLLAAGAVLAAPRGRRLRSGIVLSLAGGGAALAAALALRVVEQGIVNAAGGSAVSPEAAAAVSGAFLDPLSGALRSVLVLALLAVGVLYAAGHPSRWSGWALRHLRIYQGTAAALTVLVLFLPGLAPGIVLGVAAVMVAVIVVLEVMARTQRTPALA